MVLAVQVVEVVEHPRLDHLLLQRAVCVQDQAITMISLTLSSGAQFDCANQFATEFSTEFPTKLPIKSYAKNVKKWKLGYVLKLSRKLGRIFSSAIELTP